MKKLKHLIGIAPTTTTETNYREVNISNKKRYTLRFTITLTSRLTTSLRFGELNVCM